MKKNGRLEVRGFSHFFNEGIKENVEAYKALGVTDKGISDENLAKAREMFDTGKTDYGFDFYGFFWTQPFGGVYKNKESGKISSETLVFIPCDEDTGIPLPEYAMTQARLNDILSNYERVNSVTDETAPSGNQNVDDDDEQKAFEEFMRMKKEGK